MVPNRLRDDGRSLLRLNDIQAKAKGSVLDKIKSGAYPLEAVDCLLCGGANFIAVAEKDRYGLPMSVQVCRECGLLQTTPRMSGGAYAEFYDNEYRPLYVGTEQPDEQFFAWQVRRGNEIIRWLD